MRGNMRGQGGGRVEAGGSEGAGRACARRADRTAGCTAAPPGPLGTAPPTAQGRG